MSNYKFRSDELYKETLPNKEIDKKVGKVTQQPFDVPIESNPKIYKYTTSRLRVRKAPDGEVLRILETNTEVEVLKEYGDGWTQLVDGTYVMSRYLR